jgi:hypothetical protein
VLSHKQEYKAMEKTKFILLLLIPLTLALFSGCSSDNPTEPGPTPNTSAPLSKLSDIQVKVFTQSCALAGCHGSANNQANLLLTDGNSFSNLVNKQSFLFPQFIRVEPGNSANSLLIKILKGEVSPRMPLNGTPLSAAVIDSIAKWINNGALNN